MTVTARRAALAALATAAALGATVLTAPAFAAEAPKQGEASAPADASKLGGAPKPVEAPSSNDASKPELKDGKLEWGVKQSLRDDIKGGKVKTDGARQAKGNGVFTFGEGKGTYDTATDAVTITFKDSLRFQGNGDAEHGYKLDLKLSDLKVVTATKDKKGEITATVTKGGGTPKEKVVIATLERVEHSAQGGVHTFKKIPAKLTADGAEAFAQTDGEKPYKEGDELDSLDFSAKVATAEPTNNGGNTGNEGNGNGSSGGASGGEQGKETDNKGKEGEQKAGTDVVDGNLDWGLSDTFRQYIDRTSGKATVDGDAKRFTGGYRFTKGEGKYDATAKKLDVTFKGAVRFTAHGGDVDLKLTDLQVKVEGKAGTVTAMTNRSTKAIPLAKLALAGDFPEIKDGVLTLSAVPATLTPEGAAALTFKNKDTIVKSGDALDPLTVNVATDRNAKLPDVPAGTGSDKSTATTDTTGATATNTSATTGGTGSTATTGGTATDTTASGSLASTGANTPTGPLLGGAAALIAVGGGAVYAARRRKTGQQG
ncbi:HtaA domain-containing protein [Streptomyces sp. NPDC001719]